MAEKMGAYQYYTSIGDTSNASKYDSAETPGYEKNPYVIRDWEDIVTTYNGASFSIDTSGYGENYVSIGAAYILVNDIDFDKIPDKKTLVLSNKDGKSIPIINCCYYFDFNGYSIRNAILRNFTGSDCNVCLFTINYLYDTYVTSAAQLTIKNVKFDNLIISETYPTHNNAGTSMYKYTFRNGIYIIGLTSNKSTSSFFIDGLTVNLTVSNTNYAKTQVELNGVSGYSTDLIKYICIGIFNLDNVNKMQITHKNVYIKISGMVRHNFGLNNTDHSLCTLPLSILTSGSGTYVGSATSYNTYYTPKQFLDCTIDFNDFIIDCPIDLFIGSGIPSFTQLFPYTTLSCDSIHFVGNLKFLLPSQESIDANQYSQGKVIIFNHSSNTNIVWDAGISIINDVVAPNFKISNSVSNKLIMNRDNIDPVVLENNIDSSNGAIVLATTEQMKDPEFLAQNGLFFLQL